MARRALILLFSVAVLALVAAMATGSWPFGAGPGAGAPDPASGELQPATERQERGAPQGDGALAVDAKPEARSAKPAPTKGIALSKTPVPGGTHFRLPDGSWAPALNGVRNAPAMNWPPDIPWSPIKRKIRGKDGKEYYEHFDGSYSLTDMLYRSDLGRAEPVTHVMNPQKVQGPSGSEFGPRALKK